MTNSVELGFIEECESWQLESRFFPCKIGGKPAWLDLKNIPGAKQLACDYCENPCVFLCQVYAPFDDERAFHRTIFIFICKNPDCCKDNCNGNIKVLRSQLERVNEFYPSDPPLEEKDWRPDISIEKWSKTCYVCGIFASSHCAKCKQVHYCCRAHQVLDWKSNHKNICGIEQPCEGSNNKFLFPEFELVKEKENYIPKKNDSSATEELEKFQKLVESGQAGTLQCEKDIDEDLLKMASDLDDTVFSKFRERIESEPEQVLRYDIGGQLLLISSSSQPQNIPNCEECGGERQFEFQIMPQLLVYLNIENILSSIDWGILAVYTCKDSCVTQSKYVQEYVWKQDIVKENLSDN